jgi:sec-independent protein translocase protein TatB
MLSIPHMIVVFVIVLVVFGPQKLPELARGLGKLMAEFRKASTDFKSAFEEEMRDLERQAREVERKKAALMASAAAAQAQPAQPATLATPSSAETQPPAAELAASTEEARATEEAETLTPMLVAESVARSSEPAAMDPGETPAVSNDTAEAKPEASRAGSSLNPAHDQQQPA